MRTYTYAHAYIYIYIYIYISHRLCVCVCFYIYIYIYIKSILSSNNGPASGREAPVLECQVSLHSHYFQIHSDWE